MLLNFRFCLDLFPGIGLLGPKVLLCYFSNEHPYSSPYRTYYVIVKNAAGGFPALHTLSGIDCLHSVWPWPYLPCDVVFCCSLDLHFSV